MTNLFHINAEVGHDGASSISAIASLSMSKTCTKEGLSDGLSVQHFAMISVTLGGIAFF